MLPLTKALTSGALALALAGSTAALGAGAAASTSPPSSVAVNAGGAAATADAGTAYQADRGFTGGKASKAAPVSAPGDIEVYRTLRYGMTGYDVAVPSGTYTVTLKMIENYFSASGKRKFDVSLEGSRVLEAFDVHAAAKGKNRGVDRTFTTTVTDDRLDVDFRAVTNNPSVAAIVVTPVAEGSQPAPAPGPAPAPAPADPQSVTVLAGGDIAKPGGAQARTADLIGRVDPDAVLMLGDAQYDDGTTAEFNSPGGYVSTWGRHLSRTMPVTGNHEWRTKGAAGYRSVFDPVTGGRWWHSRDVGAWHVIGLDSNCGYVGGCGSTSAQVKWLKADLAANDGKPTIVMWHHPRWSSGDHLDNSSTSTLWRTAVADSDVQVVLWAHDHNYERFSPTGVDGARTSSGARAFVVGTGGTTLRPAPSSDRDPRSALFSASSHGLLQLTLRDDGYDWEFLRVNGSLTDAGSSDLRP